MKYRVVSDKEVLYMIKSCENYGEFEKFLKNSDDFDFREDLMEIGVETAVSNKIDIPRKYFGVFDKLISFIFKYKLKKVNIVELYPQHVKFDNMEIPISEFKNVEIKEPYGYLEDVFVNIFATIGDPTQIFPDCTEDLFEKYKEYLKDRDFWRKYVVPLLEELSDKLKVLNIEYKENNKKDFLFVIPKSC